MATITYDSIFILGVHINRILSLCIQHKINEHGIAVIKAEMDPETAKEDVARLTDSSFIKIVTTASEQPECLFYGVVTKTRLSFEDTYAVLDMTLASTSYLLDITKNSRSFQNIELSYADIFQKIFADSAEISMNVTDMTADKIVMQYNETDWEFTKRIASRFGVSVVSEIATMLPKVVIGVPESKRILMVETNNGIGTFGNDMGCMVGTGTSYDYGFIGDRFGSKGIVVSVQAEMVGGILKCNYQYGEEKMFRTSCIQHNTQIAGKMFLGEVKKVKEDKVRVHLFEIDKSFDESTNYWFPYSTAYSSKDGSGFYCMPAERDFVRVFFPSGNEADAFAASSVNVSPQQNPLYKAWRNSDKELLLTPEGIRISCNNSNIYISMNDAKGITIYSDKDINVASPKKIKISSTTCVEIEGKEEVLLHTGESFIDVLPDGICFGGKEMLIN